MRSARIAAVAALCVGSLAGCTADEPVVVPEEADEGTGTATYVAPGGAFEVDVPSGWVLTQTSLSVSARPEGAEGPSTPVVSIQSVPVDEDDFDLDAYLEEEFAQSPVAVEFEGVDVPGAAEARLVEPQFEDGGRALLVAVDGSGEDVVLVDVLWGDGELDVDEARAIATSLRFAPHGTADT